ncbi:Enoyl-CoA hydratase/isomerase family protein expressed [Citrus sinensis]|uniref:Enoyl-CoA hydratase/isomerase family protein expressed n=1 Tax=Citrus sinensis TaxID=2711 RepID=A0ACB8K8E0_CITSI|nr:Enoyl-CoA hydratase/isomerase family protein expressed [Citrus sinensis]
MRIISIVIFWLTSQNLNTPNLSLTRLTRIWDISFMGSFSEAPSRIIGPNRGREISMTATPITAEQGERWGLVNHVVEESARSSYLQERAHDYYNGMTKEQFKKMQEFIAARSSKKPSSKL